MELGLALGERDPDSLDFSIAPAAVAAAVHAAYPSVEQIGQRSDDLRARLARVHLEEGEQRGRANVLDLQLRSVRTRVDMLRGRMLPFDREAEALFHTQRLVDAEEGSRRAVRAQLASLMPPSLMPVSLMPPSQGAGRGSSLADRYAAYDRRFLVRGDQLAEVMRAALSVCREHTAKFIPLPTDKGVELAFVSHQPWSAFSRYHGQGRSTISVNVDLPVTVDEVLELACHEGYPGHHVFNTMREASLVESHHWPEAEIQLTFSPQSYVSEAAAAFAPRLVFSLEERTRVEREVLFPLAGLPVREAERYVRLSSLVRRLDAAEPAIARDYLDGGLEFVRAEQALADEALMGHAEALLLYLNEYRSYMLAYTDGRRRVAALVDAGAGSGAGAGVGAGGSCSVRDTCTQAELAMRWTAYEQLMREFRVGLP